METGKSLDRSPAPISKYPAKTEVEVSRYSMVAMISVAIAFLVFEVTSVIFVHALNYKVLNAVIAVLFMLAAFLLTKKHSRYFARRDFREKTTREIEEMIRFLHQMNIEMIQLEDIQSIYSFMTKSISERYSEGSVLAFSVNQDLEGRFEAFSGIPPLTINRLKERTGFDPTGRTYKITEQHVANFSTGNLVRFEKGLAEFEMLKNFQPEIIQEIIGHTMVYGIGLTRSERILALMVIMISDDRIESERFFIETFSRQAAIIVQKKIAECKLIASEEKLRQILSASFDATILLNPIGNPILAYPSFERMTGVSFEEINGMEGFIGRIHTDDRAKLRKGFRRIVEQGKGNVEVRFEHKNGHFINLEMAGVNQLDNPCLNAIVVNIRDITERIQLAEKYRESEDRISQALKQLTELNSTRDKLFSIIAHDLRNPISYIVGFSDLLMNENKTYINTKSKEYTEIINNSAINTLNLLDDLLIWAKSQTGTLDYKPEKLEVKPVISGVFETARQIATLKNITVSISPGGNIYCYADKRMLKTVLRNLLQNAIKYTNPGGLIELSAYRESDSTVFIVSDNGIGIEPQIKEKLFKTSMLDSKQGTSGEEGSGLGLILCIEFVEKHGGRIWAESEQGKGSRFMFSLPDQ